MTSREVTAKLGDYMLKGYTLLNLHCPLCNCPLLQKKPEPLMKCISCNRDVITQTEYDRQQATGVAPPVYDPSSEPKENGSGPRENGPESNGVGAEEEVGDDEDDDVPFWRKRTSADIEREKRENEQADRMGEKMLQGWAMLDRHCGKCSCPLMRHRDGTLYCAGCNANVDENGKPLQSTEAKVRPQTPPAEEKATSAKDVNGAPSVAEEEEPASNPPETKQPQQQRSPGGAEEGKSRFLGAPFPAASPATAETATGGVVQSTKDAILGKLAQADARLRSTSNLSEIGELARVIAALAAALKALQDVQTLDSL
eukprot:CAMPEP_0170172642 /NCGR_PEP_ID=MMETSP0040_2-20121228/5894_1 /TAXON_ID=641309 /ORGANISM="Lotharella oceanica, Strain CCMP622" /LENGTH=312 /DNA_ID=CAMNT_0010413413 /DNA_START=59 /DNA_END=997 /DNA_ORIENTATION=-